MKTRDPVLPNLCRSIENIDPISTLDKKAAFADVIQKLKLCRFVSRREKRQAGNEVPFQAFR
jgi:hypothetical protein